MQGVPGSGRPCFVDGCDRAGDHRGWCARHYRRWQRSGDPTGLKSLPVEERFWSKVDRSDPDGCWPWKRGRFSQGYGAFYLNGRQHKAHRIAWTFTNGPIPDGVLVRHHCDNPPCCRPDHLLLGAHVDNTADMDTRGRRVIGRTPPEVRTAALRKFHDEHPGHWAGERNGRAKLTTEQVVEIRQRRAAGVTLVELATTYGITSALVSRIARRLAWTHVP